MRTRPGAYTVILLIFVLVLSACGGGNDVTDEVALSDEADHAAPVEPGMELAEPDVDAGELTGNDAVLDAAQIDVAAVERRVIRSGELEVEVSDVRGAVRHARETAVDIGGFVASSSSRTLNDDGERADIALEVPSEAFETVMDRLRESRYVIRVEHESTSSQDVTEEYVDLNARLSNLQSTEARFVELLDEADTISEILSVEQEISRIRGEIERIQGRINYLDQRTNYSRIYASFLPVDDSDGVAAGGYFTPGETAREAWDASMRFVGAAGNAIVTIVVFFWWFWPVVAIALVVGMLVRRRYAARRAVA